MALDVAITAGAMRTALGDDAQATWERIARGESAVGPVVGFDASGFGDDLQAAQIWREPETPEDDPALRILGPHGRLLDGLAREAHAAAGLASFAREEVGLFVGMGMVDSPVEDLAAAALASRDGGDAMSSASFFKGAYRQIHPLWPLSMLNNVAVGQIAIDLDIRGDNIVLASDASAGARAILEGAYAVQEGRARAVLAAGVSSRVSPARFARLADAGLLPETVPGEGGAALVLERADAARARGAEILGLIRGGGSAFDSTRSGGAWSRHPTLSLGDLDAGGPAVEILLGLALRRAGHAEAPPGAGVVMAGRRDGSQTWLIVEEAA